MDYIYIDSPEVAKIIRKDLKDKFPGQKFSVKTSKYSGGSSINVDWTDGPTTKAVDEVIKRYAGASFDAMQDLKEYHKSEYQGKTVRFGSDYVFSQRDYSVSAFTAFVEAERLYWGLPEAVEVKVTSSGSPYIEDIRVDNAREWLQTLVMRRAFETDLTNGIPAPIVEQAAPIVEPEPVSAEPAICEVCGGVILDDDGTDQDGRKMHQACYTRVSLYADKVAARYERMLARAEKLQGEANSLHEAAHKMGEFIPFGQPILVGHHSEKRDRNYRERIHRTFEKSFEQYKKAERLKERATAAKHNRAISSDDPAAVIKLREKLAKLEDFQAEAVRLNAIVRDLIKVPRVTAAQKEAKRKAHTEAMNSANSASALNALYKAEHEEEAARVANYPALIPELMKRANISERTAANLLKPDFMNRVGIPDFAIKNNGAEIRRCKARIEELLAKNVHASTEGNTEIEYTGNITIIVNREENRLQISFPGKPAQSTRDLLKQNGFKWAPSQSVWQRFSSDHVYIAQDLLKKIGAMPIEEAAPVVEVVAEEAAPAVKAETTADILRSMTFDEIVTNPATRFYHLVDYWFWEDTNEYPFEKIDRSIPLNITGKMQRFVIGPIAGNPRSVEVKRLIGGQFEHCMTFVDGKSTYDNYQAARQWIRESFALSVIYGDEPEPEE